LTKILEGAKMNRDNIAKFFDSAIDVSVAALLGFFIVDIATGPVAPQNYIVALLGLLVWKTRIRK
jgi:hypothetical protein